MYFNGQQMSALFAGVAVPMLRVEVTQNEDGTYTASHTHAQILDGYNNGNMVYCAYKTMVLPLTIASKPACTFSCINAGNAYHISVGITSVTMETSPVGAETADAVLYTPQELTEEQQAQARENIGIDALPTAEKTNYRLIAKIVFDETNQTELIKITQDMDGNPLELTKVVIYADWLAATSRADCKIKLNNIDFKWFFNLEQTAYKTILEAEMFEDLCYINYYSKIPGTSKAEGGGVYAVNIPELKINEIVWRTLGVNPPPNGSTFAVYGY